MTKHTESAGGVVLNEEGEVLVVSQWGDSWSLPKGHLDEWETARQAAEREICEESGVCTLEFVRELGSYDRYRTGKDGVGDDTGEMKHMTIFLFRGRAEEAAPQGREHPEVRWVARGDVANLLTNPKDKEFFNSIADQVVIS